LNYALFEDENAVAKMRGGVAVWLRRQDVRNKADNTFSHWRLQVEFNRLDHCVVSRSPYCHLGLVLNVLYVCVDCSYVAVIMCRRYRF